MCEGEHGGEMFIVINGTVEFSKSSGAPCHPNHHRKGGFFGEMSIIAGALQKNSAMKSFLALGQQNNEEMTKITFEALNKRDCTATATENSDLCFLSKEDGLGLMRNHDSFRLKLMTFYIKKKLREGGPAIQEALNHSDLNSIVSDTKRARRRRRSITVSNDGRPALLAGSDGTRGSSEKLLSPVGDLRTELPTTLREKLDIMATVDQIVRAGGQKTGDLSGPSALPALGTGPPSPSSSAAAGGGRVFEEPSPRPAAVHSHADRTTYRRLSAEEIVGDLDILRDSCMSEATARTSIGTSIVDGPITSAGSTCTQATLPLEAELRSLRSTNERILRMLSVSGHFHGQLEASAEQSNGQSVAQNTRASSFN